MKRILNVDLFTVEEVAEMFGCSVAAIRKSIVRGKLRGCIVSGKRYFSRDELVKYLTSGESTGISGASVEPTKGEE